MNIKIGGWYLIDTEGFYMDGNKKIHEYIVEVKEHIISKGLTDVKWRCRIKRGRFSDENRRFRRRVFKVHLGDNYEDALNKHPEYFI